jgi:2-C-methyl-D-erythritol 4-phosphate cytidylyltransferase
LSLHLLIAAAGSGERMGLGLPKALAPLRGRSILRVALDAFEALEFEKGVVLCPEGEEARFGEAIGGRWPVRAGGATRAETVEIGVRFLDPGPADFVVIHDAARPLIGTAEIRCIVDAARGSGAAIAVIPVSDTLKRVEDGRVRSTVDRSGIVSAATPQVFRGELLRRAIAQAPRATDEASRVEAVGGEIRAVAVSRRAFKITYREDLEMAERIGDPGVG